MSAPVVIIGKLGIGFNFGTQDDENKLPSEPIVFDSGKFAYIEHISDERKCIVMEVALPSKYGIHTHKMIELGFDYPTLVVLAIAGVTYIVNVRISDTWIRLDEGVFPVLHGHPMDTIMASSVAGNYYAMDNGAFSSTKQRFYFEIVDNDKDDYRIAMYDGSNNVLSYHEHGTLHKVNDNTICILSKEAGQSKCTYLSDNGDENVFYVDGPEIKWFTEDGVYQDYADNLTYRGFNGDVKQTGLDSKSMTHIEGTEYCVINSYELLHLYRIRRGEVIEFYDLSYVCSRDDYKSYWVEHIDLSERFAIYHFNKEETRFNSKLSDVVFVHPLDI